MANEKKLTGAQIFLLEMVLPAILQLGTVAAKPAIQKVYDEDQQGKDLVSTGLMTIYPIVDVYLEKYAAKSKTKIDDKGVKQFKTLMEELAEDNGITLPNLDAD